MIAGTDDTAFGRIITIDDSRTDTTGSTSATGSATNETAAYSTCWDELETAIDSFIYYVNRYKDQIDDLELFMLQKVDHCTPYVPAVKQMAVCLPVMLMARRLMWSKSGRRSFKMRRK